MYQSLHTTVIGPGRERIEIQIRTHDMHRVAERGIAAHWKYKEKRRRHRRQRRAALRVAPPARSSGRRSSRTRPSSSRGVKVDLFQDEVYVFTPKGDVRVFPRGATPVDFAFAIHSQLGEHITGARVNGKLEPLRYKLRNGDVVEVDRPRRTSSRPRTGSTSSARRARARRSGRSCAPSSARSRSVSGKELLEREMQKAGVSLPKLLQERRTRLRKVLEQLARRQRRGDASSRSATARSTPRTSSSSSRRPTSDGKAAAPPDHAPRGHASRGSSARSSRGRRRRDSPQRHRRRARSLREVL